MFIDEHEYLQDSDHIYVYGGNLTVIVDRHPWRLSIYDNTTRKLYVQEAAEPAKRLVSISTPMILQIVEKYNTQERFINYDLYSYW